MPQVERVVEEQNGCHYSGPLRSANDLQQAGRVPLRSRRNRERNGNFKELHDGRGEARNNQIPNVAFQLTVCDTSKRPLRFPAEQPS